MWKVPLKVYKGKAFLHLLASIDFLDDLKFKIFTLWNVFDILLWEFWHLKNWNQTTNEKVSTINENYFNIPWLNAAMHGYMVNNNNWDQNVDVKNIFKNPKI